MAAQFRLRVVDGGNRGDVFDLPTGRTVVIGRDQASLPPDICLNRDRTVRRQHCQIQATGCGAWVLDLDGRSRTFVNGQVAAIGVWHFCGLRGILWVGGATMHLEVAAEVDARWLLWNDGVVRKLATRVRDGDDFTCMPVLADALEEAGCTDEAILGHLRDPGPHVRECWVIDLLLDKR